MHSNPSCWQTTIFSSQYTVTATRMHVRIHVRLPLHSYNSNSAYLCSTLPSHHSLAILFHNRVPHGNHHVASRRHDAGITICSAHILLPLTQSHVHQAKNATRQHYFEIALYHLRSHIFLFCDIPSGTDLFIPWLRICHG
jgi:hypothetical protein